MLKLLKMFLYYLDFLCFLNKLCSMLFHSNKFDILNNFGKKERKILKNIKKKKCCSLLNVGIKLSQ